MSALQGARTVPTRRPGNLNASAICLGRMERIFGRDLPRRRSHAIRAIRRVICNGITRLDTAGAFCPWNRGTGCRRPLQGKQIP